MPHVLKDGADSVGIEGALSRVYVNTGEFHEEWLRHFNPLVGGKRQTPLDVGYMQRNSTYWLATEERAPKIAAYFLKAAVPHRLADAPGGKPDVLLLATGSEVPLCVQAHEQLKAEGIKARVVSMPSWGIFEHHCRDNPGYRESVLPRAVTNSRNRSAVTLRKCG